MEYEDDPRIAGNLVLYRRIPPSGETCDLGCDYGRADSILSKLS